MSLRAHQLLSGGLIRPWTVKSGSTLAIGDRVIFDTSDDVVDKAGNDSDLAFGIVCAIGGSSPGLSNAGGAAPTSVTGNAAGTVKVDVLLDGHAVIPVTVTTAATRGKKAVWDGTGYTDAPTNGGGTVLHSPVGVFLQSGVTGDKVGLMVQAGRSVSAT